MADTSDNGPCGGGGLGSWMALPLFNREASPCDSRQVLPYNEQKEPQVEHVLVNEFDFDFMDCTEPSAILYHHPIMTEEPFCDDFCMYDPDLITYDEAAFNINTTASTPYVSPPSTAATIIDSAASSCWNHTYDDETASICSQLELPPDLIPDHASQHSGDSSPASMTSAMIPDHLPHPSGQSSPASTSPPATADSCPYPATCPYPTKCPYPGCESSAHFSTPRDFRRHYRQHFKRFFCRYESCPQSAKDPENPGKKGFATRKDRARHEAKHNPEIKCQWEGSNGETCSRVFSRMDNMRDHVRRIHGRKP